MFIRQILCAVESEKIKKGRWGKPVKTAKENKTGKSRKAVQRWGSLLLFLSWGGQAGQWGTAEKWAGKGPGMLVWKSLYKVPARGCAGVTVIGKITQPRREDWKQVFGALSKWENIFFPTPWAIIFHFQISVNSLRDVTVLELSRHLGLMSRKVQLCVCPCGLNPLNWSQFVWQCVKNRLCTTSFGEFAFSCCPAFFNPRGNVGSSL